MFLSSVPLFGSNSALEEQLSEICWVNCLLGFFDGGEILVAVENGSFVILKNSV